MTPFTRLALAAAFTVLSFGTAMAGNDLSPADSKAMHDYALSMDKVKAMGAAMDDFQALGKTDPAFKNAKPVGNDSKSLAEMESRIAANPKMMGVLKKHGLSAHDMAIMPFVLMYAGMCVEYPSAAPKLAQQTSPAQIAFYRQHRNEMKAMKWLNGSSG
ncbi:MAG: hypothetical protein ACREHE_09105 [Rhizomicrobium sp.]